MVPIYLGVALIGDMHSRCWWRQFWVVEGIDGIFYLFPVPAIRISLLATLYGAFEGDTAKAFRGIVAIQLGFYSGGGGDVSGDVHIWAPTIGTRFRRGTCTMVPGVGRLTLGHILLGDDSGSCVLGTGGSTTPPSRCFNPDQR